MIKVIFIHLINCSYASLLLFANKHSYNKTSILTNRYNAVLSLTFEAAFLGKGLGIWSCSLFEDLY